MTRPTFLLRTLAVMALAVSLWCGWRWVALGRAVATNRRALASALQAPAGAAPRDRSAHVAYVVERDERLFDDTLILVGARRTAGALALWFAVASFLTAVVSTRR